MNYFYPLFRWLGLIKKPGTICYRYVPKFVVMSCRQWWVISEQNWTKLNKNLKVNTDLNKSEQLSDQIWTIWTKLNKDLKKSEQNWTKIWTQIWTQIWTNLNKSDDFLAIIMIIWMIMMIMMIIWWSFLKWSWWLFDDHFLNDHEDNDDHLNDHDDHLNDHDDHLNDHDDHNDHDHDDHLNDHDDHDDYLNDHVMIIWMIMMIMMII